jgi:hypothetical protein
LTPAMRNGVAEKGAFPASMLRIGIALPVGRLKGET